VISPSDPLICFDLGGVLVRICRSWQEGCAAAGIDADRGWSPAEAPEQHRNIIEAYSVGALDTPTFFKQLEQTARGVYSADDFRLIHTAWIGSVYEGVEALLDELRSAGLTIACLSNTNAAHWDELITWPALCRLDHRHASHLIGLAKPDPAMYEWFARTLGVDARQIVFFDDLAENVAAANRCGWDAIQIDCTADTTAQIRAALKSRSLLG